MHDLRELGIRIIAIRHRRLGIRSHGQAATQHIVCVTQHTLRGHFLGDPIQYIVGPIDHTGSAIGQLGDMADGIIGNDDAGAVLIIGQGPAIERIILEVRDLVFAISEQCEIACQVVLIAF